MKRSYKKPLARKVDFSYDEQVVADSQEPWYCFVQIWQGPQSLGICQNPNEWTGDQLYLNPKTKSII